jgi:hypothetical protein
MLGFISLSTTYRARHGWAVLQLRQTASALPTLRYLPVMTCKKDANKTYLMTIAHILSLVGMAFNRSTFKPEYSTIKRNVSGVK